MTAAVTENGSKLGVVPDHDSISINWSVLHRIVVTMELETATLVLSCNNEFDSVSIVKH